MRTHEYRADIDGLRALAIVPVLLFHAGFEFAGGGYVGVDVFFVISGYLITSLLHAEMSAGRFSLLRFYERRVRRLFPAMFVMLLGCALFAAWLLLPQDLRYFGGSLVATTLFASNIFFWLEAGYFDSAAELKPLLHTWSLAVEEQFYLAFPLFLLLALRYLPRRVVALIAGLAVGSLILSEWGVRHAAPAAFYLAPFRAWELGLGALLALGPLRLPANRAFLEFGGVLGLGLIAWAVCVFSWQTPFPGLHALAPGVGTALLIWTGTGPGTTVTRVLRHRAVVFVGLISYSLYLWHWPVLVFARHFAIRELTSLERTALLSVSVVLAVLSWRFVERPFRGRQGAGNRTQILTGAAIAMSILCAAGLAAVVMNGWPGRMDTDSKRMMAGAEDYNERREECSYLEAADLRAGKACRLGLPVADARPAFIVWGDSHADALMPVFDRLAREHARSGLYLGKIGCPPLLGVERADVPFHCRAFNDAARDLIGATPDAPVVLVARWSHFTDRPTYGQEDRTVVILADDESAVAATRSNDAVLERGLRRTMDFLQGREVFVVLTVPEIGYDVPRSLANIERFGRAVDIRPTLQQYVARQSEVSTILSNARQRHSFSALDPAAVLCAGRICRVTQEGHPLYFDSHHLSTRGANFIAGALQPVFEPAH